MDNVFGHVMVAITNEYLLTRNEIMLAFFDGFCFDRSDIRTRLGFRHIHRAAPLATNHFGKKFLFGGFIAVRCKQFDGPNVEHRAQSKRDVCRLQHIKYHYTYERRQALSSEFFFNL